LSLLATALVLVVAAGAFTWWKFGSFLDFRRLWSPGTLTILDRQTDLGKLPADGTFLFRVRVRNDAAKPLTIVGAKSACSCMAAEKLPATLAPGEIHGMLMALRLDRAKSAAIPVVVYTEDGQTHEAIVDFNIESKLASPSPPPAGGVSPVAAGNPPRGAS
jgi:hypothetical protein